MSRNRLLPRTPAIAASARLILPRRSRSRSRRLNRLDARLLSQSNRQHLINPLDRLDLEVPLNVVGNLHEVLLVLIRNQDSLDPTPMSSQQLFLQAANGENLTAQGDFARHSDVRANRNLRQRRNQRSAHSNAGARTVLRSGALWDVQVNVELLVELLFETEDRSPAANNSHRCLDGLLHHLAQLASVLQFALTRNNSRFDRQQLATHFRPGEARDLTHAVQILCLAVTEALHAQELVQVARSDRNLLLLLLM